VTDEKSGAPVRCWIYGQRISIKQISARADYAIIHADHYPQFRATISCARLEQGAIYFASGYAEGNPWLVTTRLRGTGSHEDYGENVGTANVGGSLINGMSGGAVADPDGATHAIIDWRDDDGIPDGGVVELADTPLCRKER